MKIHVKAKEVKDGRKYSGTISTGEGLFGYEIRFRPSINVVDACSKIPFLALPMIGVKVNDQGREIRLDRHGKAFVILTGGQTAIELYNSDQRRGYREDKVLKDMASLYSGNVGYELGLTYDIPDDYAPLKHFLSAVSDESAQKRQPGR